MKRFIFSLFIILSFYTGAYYCMSIFCANCTDVSNYTACFDELVRCQGTQYCKFERKIVDNQTQYTLGCADHDECHPKSTTLPTKATLSSVTLGASTTPAMTTNSTFMTLTTTEAFNTTDNHTGTTQDPANTTIAPNTTTSQLSELSTLQTTATHRPETNTTNTRPAVSSARTNASTASTPILTPDPSKTISPNVPTHTPKLLSTLASVDLVGKRYLPQLMSDELEDVISTSEDHCLECCQGNTCNIETLACVPGLCYDKLGQKSCVTAKESFNVCNNITFAKNMCKATCGLCNLADGNWGAWSGWSECSRTCGVGLRFKDRTCSHPAPDQNGLFCQGEPRDYEVCMNDTCEDGHWMSWSGWSACSSTCGVGLKTRSRDCGGQLGHSCPGPNTESDLCHTSQCDDAMSAFATTGVPAPGERNATLKFTLVRTNVGHDYDNETGVYTCRVPGIFQFFVSIEKQTNVSQAYCHLMVNNSSTILIAARSAFINSDAFQQASNSMVLDLKKAMRCTLGAAPILLP